MKAIGLLRSRRSAWHSSLLFLSVVAVTAVLGSLGFKLVSDLGATSSHDHKNLAKAATIDTIFMPLAREIVPIPSDAVGSGGAMADWGGVPIVLTSVGELFAIEDGTATRLAISAPENRVEAYAAHVAETSDRDPAAYWFRYNDLMYIRDRNELAMSYSRWNETEACVTNAIAVVQAQDRPGPIHDNWRVLYETRPCLPISEFGSPVHGQMAGGRLALSPTGHLLLASGDYGKDGLHAQPVAAQTDGYDYGKVMAIDLDTGAARQISSGHSNPQGIAIDRDGHIWVVEHGRRGGDELNRIEGGKNYGWPLTSLGTRYNKLAIPSVIENGRHSEAFEAPVFAWLPSVAPGALALIEGFDPLWDGDLLVGSLKDQALYRIRLRNDRVLFAERIPIGQRIRYVQVYEDGRIALFTDAKTVEFLTVGAADHVFEYAAIFAEQLDVDAATRAEFLATVNACAQCHTLGQSSGGEIPALGGVFGSAFSESIATKHSASLGANGQVWDLETLTAFLDDPDAFAPGTSMPDPMLDQGELLSNLILFLYALAKIPQ